MSWPSPLGKYSSLGRRWRLNVTKLDTREFCTNGSLATPQYGRAENVTKFDTREFCPNGSLADTTNTVLPALVRPQTLSGAQKTLQNSIQENYVQTEMHLSQHTSGEIESWHAGNAFGSIGAESAGVDSDACLSPVGSKSSSKPWSKLS